MKTCSDPFLWKDTSDKAYPSETSKNELTINSVEASQTATANLTASAKMKTMPLPEISEPGKGEVNYASTWDEFPNGRFGDFKSPAFGTQWDPWNAGLGSALGISVCLLLVFMLAMAFKRGSSGQKLFRDGGVRRRWTTLRTSFCRIYIRK